MYSLVSAVAVYVHTNLQVCIWMYVHILTYVGICVYVRRAEGVLCVPCTESPNVCMLYFTGDSSSMYTLPVCLQNDCVQETLCVCIYICVCIYVCSEQVYIGISYLFTDVCVYIYIHRSLDVSPHYTNSNKDISKFSQKVTMYF